MEMQNVPDSTDPEPVGHIPLAMPEHVTTIQGDAFRPETPAGQRQKRKRTSPRDHAILESAYQLNSKPDKEARLSLVQRVDLGEKEVQIWFQNRRQNDRRKAKPLQPHELIPHFRNGIPAEATKQLPSPDASQVRPTEQDANDYESRQVQHSPQDSSPLRRSSQTAYSAPIALQDTPSHVNALNTPPSSIECDRRQIQNVSLQSAQDVQVDSTIVKKRSYEQMTGTDLQRSVDKSSSSEAKSLRRTSSFMRLAVSADGSVKVRVNDETTPSPPKERPAPALNAAIGRSSTLARAKSDVSAGFNFKDVSSSIKGAIGRSRDARTWEFYCDRSARSSLAARAEEAANGSAVGALGLMRSASQKRTQPLAANRAKQNHLRRTDARSKTKPGLARTHSSMARLQSLDGVHDQDHHKQPQTIHKRHRSGSDSDKENWMPGTRSNIQNLRSLLPTSHRDAPLREQESVEASEDRLPILLPGGHHQDTCPAPTGSKAKGDDLDCVQGLLSLSQGAWR